MVKKCLVFLILVFCIACTSTQNTSQSEKQKNVSVIINDGKKIHQGEKIEFIVSNINKSSILIFNPEKLFIERKQNNLWKKLQILYCPCDAPCKAPKDKQFLSTNNTLNILWDQRESWCGPKTNEQIRESIYQFVDKGEYRFRIDYQIDEGKQIMYYKYFKIY